MHGGRSLSIAFGLLVMLLAACSTGTKTPAPASSPTASPSPGASASPTTSPSPAAGIGELRSVAIPGIVANGKFSFGDAAADVTARRLYLADRTNASLDIVDLDTFAVRRVTGGFTGTQSNAEAQGPNGVVAVPNGSVYVSDVDSVKVVDPVAGTVTKSIVTDTAGLETGTGCYDPDDKLIMFANPYDATPYVSFVSPGTNSIIATLAFPGSSGLGACVYDPGTKEFFINNVGSTTNPNGELDSIIALDAAAGIPSIAEAYAEGTCGPNGIALGPSEHLAIGCDVPSGSKQVTLVMSATSGAILTTIAKVGGSGEVAYDSSSNRYYTASNDWTANGTSQTGKSNATFTPVLGIIDAANDDWLANIPTGTGSHALAVDSSNGNILIPFASSTATPGGIDVYGP
jgi:hypothetical protein